MRIYFCFVCNCVYFEFDILENSKYKIKLLKVNKLILYDKKIILKYVLKVEGKIL